MVEQTVSSRLTRFNPEISSQEMFGNNTHAGEGVGLVDTEEGSLAFPGNLSSTEPVTPGINLSHQHAVREGFSSFSLAAFKIDIDEGPDGTESGSLGLRDYIPGMISEEEINQDIEMND